MKGDPLPDADHIVRYCKSTTVPNGQIQATAFMLRLGDEALSVNWLECLHCESRQDEISEIRNLYRAKFDRVGAGARIAVLNVGGVCEEIRENSEDARELRIAHDPDDGVTGSSGIADPSHSGIYNLRDDDDLIAEMICSRILEDYPARS